jgi:DNA-binding transcriptional regulator GbsR (MarR family)
MTFNTEEEKSSLKNSLRNTENIHETLECLEHVLHHRTPFALYVATADRSDCTWIFDPETVMQMVGGEKKYYSVFDTLFPTEEEKEIGIIFFVLRKVGPIISTKIDIELIDEIINELYEEI